MREAGWSLAADDWSPPPQSSSSITSPSKQPSPSSRQDPASFPPCPCPLDFFRSTPPQDAVQLSSAFVLGRTVRPGQQLVPSTPTAPVPPAFKSSLAVILIIVHRWSQTVAHVLLLTWRGRGGRLGERVVVLRQRVRPTSPDRGRAARVRPGGRRRARGGRGARGGEGAEEDRGTAEAASRRTYGRLHLPRDRSASTLAASQPKGSLARRLLAPVLDRHSSPETAGNFRGPGDAGRRPRHPKLQVAAGSEDVRPHIGSPCCRSSS